jgi:tetratricopeptide (TPR) repeat protein
MKALSFFSLLVLVNPLVAQTAVIPTKEVPAADSKTLSPNQQAFLNLPEERRNEFIKSLGEANRLFQQKRIFETMEEVGKAEKIFADSPEIYNLRGSCFVEMRSFDKALADYQKALTYTKDNPSIEFNVGEVYFVTKEWKKCLETFEKIQKTMPDDPTTLALRRLVEFKILLSKKKLGMDEDAKAMAEKYDFLDDSPYYYYAQAAIAYDNKDLIKAEEWLAIANRIFQDPNILAPWQDTLVEYGYIKSFYGDDSAPGG